MFKSHASPLSEEEKSSKWMTTQSHVWRELERAVTAMFRESTNAVNSQNRAMIGKRWPIFSSAFSETHETKVSIQGKWQNINPGCHQRTPNQKIATWVLLGKQCSVWDLHCVWSEEYTEHAQRKPWQRGHEERPRGGSSDNVQCLADQAVIVGMITPAGSGFLKLICRLGICS
jgi:hypothetical protein